MKICHQRSKWLGPKYITGSRSREAFLRNTFICEPKEYDLYGLESKPAGGSSLSCNLSLNNNTISRNCYNPFLRQRWIFQKLLQGIKCCVVNSSRGIVEKEKRNKPKGSSYVISCLSGYTLVVYRGKTISDESYLMSKSSWQTWSKKYKIKGRDVPISKECWKNVLPNEVAGL